ncbi:MAG: hypothetical protein JXB15_02160 [Anaerolineales bacterium]|nr:hypothetical protein [Anaerolineales bacterium]
MSEPDTHKSCLYLIWKNLFSLFKWTVGLGLIAGACLYLWLLIQHLQPTSLPAPGGAYPVGRTILHIIDQKRIETLAPEGEQAQRELMAFVWYPASSQEGELAAYLPEAWAKAMQKQNGLLAIFFQHYPSIQAHARENASLADPGAAGEGWPILILSAGYGLLPTDFTALAEDLASRGYVVAGVAPTYSAPAVVFPDGRVIEQSSQGSFPNFSTDNGKAADDRLVEVWARDILSTLDELARLNSDPNSLFYNRLELGHVGAFGHSFGGAASAEACLLDARILAGVDLDGTLYGKAAEQGVSQPFLIIRSQPFSAKLEDMLDKSFTATLGKGAKILIIQGMAHFNFTDMALLTAPALRWVGVLGEIDGGRGMKITADYLLAFFDQQLRGAASTLLDWPDPAYPEVTFPGQ